MGLSGLVSLPDPMAFKKFRQWPSSASLALIPSLVRFLKEETITKSERANLTRCSRASVRGFSHSWLSFEFIDEGPSMRRGFSGFGDFAPFSFAFKTTKFSLRTMDYSPWG